MACPAFRGTVASHASIDSFANGDSGIPTGGGKRDLIEEHYGYDRYPGNCHVVPNHALVMLGLLWGDDDFQTSLSIVNTAGWDTDCNSGNVGCLLGIKNGLDGIDAGPDWRGPVEDRLFLSSAEGGASVTDAVTQTCLLVHFGHQLAGREWTPPKGGARFHFSFPGSIQGWRVDTGCRSGATAVLENADGHSRLGQRSLAVRYRHLVAGSALRLTTPTFPNELEFASRYELLASPTLYPGQVIRAAIEADSSNHSSVSCGLVVGRREGADVTPVEGPAVTLEPGDRRELAWRLPPQVGHPIHWVGWQLRSDSPTAGAAYLDFLTWDGAPEFRLDSDLLQGSPHALGWVDALDHVRSHRGQLSVSQDRGLGLLSQGTRDWRDYEFEAAVTVHLAAAAGIAVRVQGRRRFYALLLEPGGGVRLVKQRGGARTLCRARLPHEPFRQYRLRLRVQGTEIDAFVDEQRVLHGRDDADPLEGGAVALVCEEGTLAAEGISVRGLTKASSPEAVAIDEGSPLSHAEEA